MVQRTIRHFCEIGGHDDFFIRLWHGVEGEGSGLFEFANIEGLEGALGPEAGRISPLNKRL